MILDLLGYGAFFLSTALIFGLITLGLNLQWKTRRIKGSVADFAVADANNDGILDLVACINTHPGALGVEKRKTIVVVYPLDLTKTEAVPTGRTDD